MEDTLSTTPEVLATGLRWVDEHLLSGPDDQVCLDLDGPVDRATLRAAVHERSAAFTDHGLVPGGTVALHLPPSLAYIVNLLAAWRCGAQVTLLDHRLTAYEAERALERVAPQLVVRPVEQAAVTMRAFVDVDAAIAHYPGRPAATPHAVIQLSSGSTGPSKMIGRTAANLAEEVLRYVRIGDGVPAPGERIVLLASMVHVLGLVGGLLYGLYAGVRLSVPPRLTASGILKTVAASPEPTTLLGVPFHAELLGAVREPVELPQLRRMTTGGELVRADVWRAFTDRYGVPLGTMYGMTEIGVIATDLHGHHRPALMPAPGIEVRVDGGELLLGMPASPYLGLVDPTRFTDGWLHTRDAGGLDPDTGLLTVLGRLDSQVSVGGLKVDLTEVEHTIADLPGVASAVVVYDGAIEAYLMLDDPSAADALDGAMAERLAAFKRPRVVHVLDQLPRTATGKLVRDATVLRAAARNGTP
ncbi:MAG: class I adenylate-forming enzyme family protein [Actinocatenispora sp.]